MDLNDWQQQALRLRKTKSFYDYEIAKQLGVPKSTLSDFFRRYEKFTKDEKELTGTTHLVIPDTQVKPGISLDYLRWIGEYIVRKRPDVVIHLGDHADMPSLSSYDRGRKAAEGRRVGEDINAAIKGMVELLSPLRSLQAQQTNDGEEIYSPRLVMLYGNHEDRITRYAEETPSLTGYLSLDVLKYQEMGWETVPFLTPIIIDGIAYCHYFQNVMTGKALGGSASSMLKTLGHSFTMGHRQMLDVSHRQLQTTGERQWGLIAGAAYVHDEDYKGVQGNKHWRGIVLKHNVKEGSYDPTFVSMDWLQRTFS